MVSGDLAEDEFNQDREEREHVCLVLDSMTAGIDGHYSLRQIRLGHDTGERISPVEGRERVSYHREVMTEAVPPKGAEDPDSKGSDAFFAQVYEELRSIAHARMRGERSGVSFQSTELVHEAYMRLAPQAAQWENRSQFFAAAAEAMRRILIDRARSRGRVKRGGDERGNPPPKISLDMEEVAVLADDRDPAAILELDQAIERLAKHDERVAQVVKLRFFAGLSIEEIAEMLGTSSRTILRDWAFARSWLYRELSSG